MNYFIGENGEWVAIEGLPEEGQLVKQIDAEGNESIFVYQLPEGTYVEEAGKWVEIQGLPSEGQKYKKIDKGGNSLVTFYSTPVDPPKRINIGQVVDELTDDEYELWLDLDTYDKKATKEEKQKSVKVKRVRNKLERLGNIPVNQFAALAQVFVEQGVLTQARFDEILGVLS